MNTKRTFGLLLLSIGVVLTLGGVTTIDAAWHASRMEVSEHVLERTALFILAGLTLAVIGIRMNPVGRSKAAN